MHFTTHLLSGAAVGAAVGQPVPAFVAGLLAHAVLDAVPHNDYHRVRYAIADILLGGVLYFHVVRKFGLPAQFGAVGGFLPDLEVALGHVILSLKPGLAWRNLFPSHSGLIPHGHASLIVGFLIQLTTAGLAILVLLLAAGHAGAALGVALGAALGL